MKKFSGIIICSDFDGTLANEGQIPQINKDAVRYFQENGGVFTLITGRGVDFVKARCAELGIGTYVGCLNGTVIYHAGDDKIVSKSFLQGELYAPVYKVCKNIDNFKDVSVFCEDVTEEIKSRFEDFEERLENALSRRVHKLLIRKREALTAEDLDLVRRTFGTGYAVSRSWSRGVEVQDEKCHKGIAARRIASLVGADTLICVGDYENDIPMLQSADIAYAVDNAIPEVKAVADRLTVSSYDGAIAAIVAQLDGQIDG